MFEDVRPKMTKIERRNNLHHKSFSWFTVQH